MTTTAEKKRRKQARAQREREEAEVRVDPELPARQARRQTLVLDAKARGTWTPELEKKLVPLWERVDAERDARRRAKARAERDAALERGLGLEREGGVLVSRPGLDGPTAEREAQTVEGQPAVEPASHGRPARTNDVIDAWEKAGAITRGAADLARRFRDDFQAGGLQALKAIDPNSLGGGGMKDLPGGLDERRRALRLLDRLGGLQSPGGVALWHVVGCEASFEQATLRMPGPFTWNVNMLRGTLLATIAALEDRRPAKPRTRGWQPEAELGENGG